MALNLDDERSGSGFFNESVSSNDSLHLCAVKYLSMTLPQPIIAIRSGQFIYNLFILIFGLALNIIIIWVPIKNKKMRNIDTAIAVHIALLNLLRTLFETLPSLVNAAAGVWVFGATSCAVQGGFVTIFTLTKRFMMLVLAIDRFLLVFSTFAYPKFHANAVKIYFTATWILSMVLLFPAFPGLMDCYTLFPLRISCFYIGSCSRSCGIYGLFLFVATLLPSYIVPMFLFGALFCKGRKSLKSTSQQAEDMKQSIKKANITFFLLFVSYVMITVPSIRGYLIEAVVARLHGQYANTHSD